MTKIKHNPHKERKGEKIGGGFWVARRHKSTGRVYGAPLPFEHPDRASAVGEARRLAKKNDGREQFVVLGVIFDTAEEAKEEAA